MSQLNLELFLAQKVKEMDQFYSQINHDSKSQVKLHLLNGTIQDQGSKDQIIASSHSTDKEHKEKRSRQTSEFRMQNEFINQETKTSEYNAFDELPIKQTSKTFEELIAEQGVRVEDSLPPKKQFLKKGTRQFLSNAQIRSEIQKKEHEEMLRMNNENVEAAQLKKKPVNFLQKGKGKQCMGKLNESIENSKSDEMEQKFLSQSQSEYQSRPSLEGSCAKSQTEDAKQSQLVSFQQKMSNNLTREAIQIKKLKSQLEQQSKELQKQKEDWNKKIELEKIEFERWKDNEKKKLDKLRQTFIKETSNKSEQRVSVTRKQLEELDHLRKVVIQLSDEIKFLRCVKQENQGSYALIHSGKAEGEPIGELEELAEVDEDDDDQREALKDNETLDLTSLWPKNKIEIQMINQVIDESKFEYSNNKFYNEYQNQSTNLKIVHQTTTQDGKVQKIYSNQKKEIIFQNGVKREVFPNGYIIVHFTNKDVKQTFPDGTIVYYFSEAKTTQVTFPQGGPNIYRFNNRQIEIHFGDNSKQIRFADGTQKYIHPDQSEETLFSDGIFQRTDANKIKYIEYPNGSMDILYPDGRKERRSPIK